VQVTDGAGDWRPVQIFLTAKRGLLLRRKGEVGTRGRAAQQQLVAAAEHLATGGTPPPVHLLLTLAAGLRWCVIRVRLVSRGAA
jgi:hypothetical protein